MFEKMPKLEQKMYNRMKSIVEIGVFFFAEAIF